MAISARTSAITVALITALGGVASVWVQVQGQKAQLEAQMEQVRTQGSKLSEQSQTLTNQESQIGSTQEKIATLQSNVVGSLEEGQKICSVVDPGNFRDSFLVPRSWKKETCINYGKVVAAPNIQIGCVFSNSVELGQFGATPPTKNCGW